MNPKELFEKLNVRAQSFAPTQDDSAAVARLLTTIQPMLVIAPASTAARFHHARPSGLMEHIIEVDDIAEKAAEVLSSKCGEVTRWNIFLVALLHDLHKASDWSGRRFYEPNILKNGKASESIPYKKSDVCFTWAGIDDTDPDGELRAAITILNRNKDLLPQGDLSLALVAAVSPDLYGRLPESVKFAVRHHDGMYGPARRELAGNEQPLQVLMHFADMVSSRAEQWNNPNR